MRNDICTTIFDNFCDNFLSHTHIMFLLFLSIALVFVPIPLFLCKIMVVPKVVYQMVVQITQLFNYLIYAAPMPSLSDICQVNGLLFPRIFI